MQPLDEKYDSWSREDLIARLTQLERPKPIPIPKKSSIVQLREKQAQEVPGPRSRIGAAISDGGTGAAPVPTISTSATASSSKNKPFDFSSHTRRKIALKFCYSGWEYGGLAYQNVHTPLPTVEGVLFDALAKSRLINPEEGLEGCGWEKCGRTDRGVSAAGQVISLWVRSAMGPEEVEVGGWKDSESRPVGSEVPFSSKAETPSRDTNKDASSMLDDGFGGLALDDDDDVTAPTNTSANTKPKAEHDYISILNRLLPPTIRILAWSPVSSDFSARFACSYRHYKYFFSSKELDLDRMKQAAERLLGEHDFRNLCKLDPAKQITMFKRKILKAEIESLVSDGGGGTPSMYVLNLVGTAFLYHQVRHIMAVLFLVGSGLEHPLIVNSLMNVEEGMEQSRAGDSPLQVVSSKPEYQMADALPLMLWECGYPAGLLDWRTSSVSTNGGMAEGLEGSGSDLYHQMSSVYSRSRIYTTLDQHFLQAAMNHHPPPRNPVFPLKAGEALPPKLKVPVNVPLGGGTFKRTAKYVEVLRRNRMDDVSVVNERWRRGKGARREERKQGEDDGDGDE